MRKNKISLQKAHLPDALYRKILSTMPVPCVDAVIVSRGRFLLGLRANNPARGVWWFVGGRMHKGEDMKNAILRKVQEETGIVKCRVVRMIATRDTMFRKGAQGTSVHTVNNVLLVHCAPGAERSMSHDAQFKGIKWFSRIDPSWPRYVKDMLRAALYNKPVPLKTYGAER
jgi:colanic acid biosynthesis protein WcaH